MLIVCLVVIIIIFNFSIDVILRRYCFTKMLRFFVGLRIKLLSFYQTDLAQPYVKKSQIVLSRS